MPKKQIAIVLSGGGERGWIQLGALQVILDENKIPFDMVVGTSVGGLVGWGLASGASVKDMIEKAEMLKERDIKKLSTDHYAIFDPSGAFDKLRKIFGDGNIEDLPKRFAVTAVDLLSGEEVILDKGPAWKAVRATVSVPSLFPPVQYENRLLIDGGVLNVLPVDVAAKMGADITIAIDVSEFARTKFAPREKGLNPLMKRLIKTTKNQYLSVLVKRSYLFESLYQSGRIMAAKIRAEKLAKYPPTVLIEAYHPPKDFTQITVDDKKYKEKLLQIGRDAATQKMNQIKSTLAAAKAAIA